MRTHGTLIKWNDDRGYGFVVLPQSHEEVFVHISAFPRDGVRPRIGEMISFEVRSGPDGKKRAEGVLRPGAQTPVRKSRGVSPRDDRKPIGTLLAIVIAGVLGVVGYKVYTAKLDSMSNEPGMAIAGKSTQHTEAAGQQFTCDGRTHCSQMTSCVEATYFLQHCPNTQMDGNNDGGPCEQQWCN